MNNKLVLGTGGTLGLMSLLGACGGACGLAVLPLGSILGAIGLGSLAMYLPYLRWPLLAAALLLSLLVLRSVLRQGKPVRVAGTALLLGIALAFAGFQAFKPTPCEAVAIQSNGAAGIAAALDPEMAKGCEMACGFHGKVDAKKVVAQPGAKVGDLVHCPVSGVLFMVKPTSPRITYDGKPYYTCCPTCAAKFNERHKT